MKYAILLESPTEEIRFLMGFTNTPIKYKPSKLYYIKYTVELKELNNLHISLDNSQFKQLKS